MKYISKKEKFNFYAGLSGQNIVYSFIGGSFFTYFMTDIALFPAGVVSVLLFLMKIWDGINDPLVGSVIDSHRFKNGEKLRPLLKYTPLPVGLFTVLLFVVFSTDDDLLWLRVGYFIILYIAWDIAYTLQDVAIWGMTAVVSPNGNERDTFVKWARIIGGAFYGVFNMLIPMIIEMVSKANGSKMATMTLVFAAILGLGSAMVSYRTYYAQERVRSNPQNQQSSIKECFKLLFQNKMLLLVTLSNLFGAIGFGGQLVTYFFKYRMPESFLNDIPLIGPLLGALGLTTIYSALTYLPQTFAMLFADKMKKAFKGYANALIFMHACNAIFRAIAFAIGFEGKNFIIGMVIMAFGCMPMGALSIAQTSIFCDSIDYMEWKTGKRTEGVTFSMQTFFTKVSSGITSSLATLALSIVGFKAVEDTAATSYLGTQTAAFDNWIWPLMMLTPVISSILCIIPLMFIKYTPAKRAQVEKELAECRAMQESVVE